MLSKPGMTTGILDAIVLFANVAALREADGYSLWLNEKKRKSFPANPSLNSWTV